jgi:hypothetical protein
MNIDLSKMKFAIVEKGASNPLVIGTFPDERDARKFLSSWGTGYNPLEIIPITPPAPKYPAAERPTHCVQSPVGVTYVLGNESSCIRWKDKYGNEEYFVATCSHWWTNEGGGQ